MDHFEMKVLPRKGNDLKFVFKWLKCGNYISSKDILEKKNYLENYLESDDVVHAY